MTDDLRARGIPYRPLKFLDRPIRPKDSRALLEVRAAIKAFDPDLISAHSAKARWLGGVAARTLGTRVLYTAHGWPFADGVSPGAARVYRVAERAVAPFAARIVTVSDYDRDLGLKYRIADAEKLVTVHNGMPEIGAQVAAPAVSPPRLIMVARFEAQKDHGTLLKALAELEQPWQLDLVGDGPRLNEMQSLAQQLGLAGRTRFLGARNDVAALLADAQIFLLITHWEGFPRSILEAMRAGLPVVASDVGGIGESVQNDVTGLLVKRGQVAELRTKLSRLLDDAALRAKYGAAGQARYQAHFTFEQMLAKTQRVYQDILAR